MTDQEASQAEGAATPIPATKTKLKLLVSQEIASNFCILYPTVSQKLSLLDVFLFAFGILHVD